MEKYRVIISPEARNDLRGIKAYITKELKAGTKQIERIRNQVNSLSYMPERYRKACFGLSRNDELHIVPVDKYVVVYSVNNESKTVEIVRIIYGGRDIESILGRE